MTGGSGCISFGTTTKSRPTTRRAPALFAVPGNVVGSANFLKY
jgi:hypothetical protein